MFNPGYRPTKSGPTRNGFTIRRKCACGGSSNSGKCTKCQEEDLLRRSSADSASEGAVAPQIVHDALHSIGQPLEENTRTLMESRLGRDFRDVRVSSDDQSAVAADAIQAKAFTYGNRIVFGRNEYAPHSLSGLRLLAHELAHTAQQGSAGSSLQTSLRVGAIDDPHEREAELAADAVMGAGQAAPSLSSAGGAIRRQPKTGGPSWEWKGVNEGVYTAEGGTKYTVIRSFKPVTTSEKTRVIPDVDFARAFVTITWCKGSVRGSAEAGLDITNQLQQLIPQILATRNPQQVLRQANLTAYVQVVAIKSDKGTLNFNIQADVDPGQKRVTGVRGEVSVDTEAGRVGVTGGVDLPQGGPVTPNVGLTFTPGSKAPNVQCETTTFKDTYECRKEEKLPDFDLPLTVYVSNPPSTRYLYFDYATDVVTSTRTQYGRDHPEIVGRNNDTFGAVRQDLQEGYRISGVEGFTSPEGPLPKKEGNKFEGNAQLAQDRADKAFQVFAEGGLCLLYRDEACFTPSKDAIKPVGRGELYTKSEGGKELEGKELAEFAVPEFRKNEESALTEKEREKLGKTRGAMAQSSIVYPLLRRAKITLRKGLTPTKIKLPITGGMRTSTVDCPRDVLEAAKHEFLKRDAGIGTGGPDFN